jgi:hypothetical protein
MARKGKLIMIYTSYFAKLNKLPSNIIPISICGKAPDWYKGLQYKKLSLKYDFFMKWKETYDNNYYIEHFKNEVLDELDLNRVMNELLVIIPFEIKEIMQSPIWVNEDYHICLMCYEKPSDFCHRHLVSDWLNENDIICEEYKF